MLKGFIEESKVYEVNTLRTQDVGILAGGVGIMKS